jgi:hypothetical protein
MEKEIKVVELFAGVGGFRLGLEGWNGKSATSGYEWNIMKILSEKGEKLGRSLSVGFTQIVFVKYSSVAFRSNLLFVPRKRISTTIPNAKTV